MAESADAGAVEPRAVEPRAVEPGARVSGLAGRVAGPRSVTAPRSLPRIVRWASSLARFEDWLLAIFVVFAAPLIVHAGARPGGAALFAPGNPVQGVLCLGAVLAALVCAAARQSPRAGLAAPRSIWGTAAVGPFTGAVLLVGASGAAALSLPGQVVELYAVAAIALMAAARLLLPPLPPVVRRALVTPFILVAGGLFWSAIDAVFTGPLIAGGVRSASVATLQSLVASPAFLFLLAFSAVYYAMLVYAPRQVADTQGGALAWGVRYAMFVAGIVVGAGWLSALGG